VFKPSISLKSVGTGRRLWGRPFCARSPGRKPSFRRFHRRRTSSMRLLAVFNCFHCAGQPLARFVPVPAGPMPNYVVGANYWCTYRCMVWHHEFAVSFRGFDNWLLHRSTEHLRPTVQKPVSRIYRCTVSGSQILGGFVSRYMCATTSVAGCYIFGRTLNAEVLPRR